MWYTSLVLAVHVPRTGGDWLTAWAAAHLPLLGLDSGWLKHLTHAQLVAAVPQLSGVQAFAVVRDEGQRRRSFFRHALQWRPADPPAHPPEWAEIAAAAHTLGEEAWIERHAPPIEHYLSPAVRLFPFEPDLAQCVAWLREVHQAG